MKTRYDWDQLLTQSCLHTGPPFSLLPDILEETTTAILTSPGLFKFGNSFRLQVVISASNTPVRTVTCRSLAARLFFVLQMEVKS